MADHEALVQYLRQSRTHERTISLAEQRRNIKGWAEGNGVRLAPEIVEAGVSGNRPWRERELGRAVEACERGEVAGVVVAWQDRLSRESALGTAEVWEALGNAGARLVCAAEGLDTATGDHELLFTIKAAIARDQWKRIRANWDGARRNAIERGQHPVPHVPFGYVDTDGDRRLLPDPETAHLVRSVFQLRAQGSSWAELVDFMQASGRTPRRGTRWTMRSVTTMISNRVYLGESFSGEYRNTEAHEPLVGRALWIAAQSKVRGRTTRGTEGARLSGIVFCATCGGRLTAGAGMYRCMARTNAHREPCTHRAYASGKPFEEHVVAAFLARYEDALGTFDDEADPPETGPLRRRLERATDVRDGLVSDPASLAALPSNKRAELLSNAQRAVDEAQQALDTLEVEVETSVLNVWKLGEYFEVDGFRELRIPEQRRLLTAGIDRVIVQPTRERPGGPIRPIEDRVEIVWPDDAPPQLLGNRSR